MNNNDLFNFLIATDQLDEFLGDELPQEIKKQISNLAKDYKKGLINDDKIQVFLMKLEKSYDINYEMLYDYFKGQLDN
jgi:hypothetical protein